MAVKGKKKRKPTGEKAARKAARKEAVMRTAQEEGAQDEAAIGAPEEQESTSRSGALELAWSRR